MFLDRMTQPRQIAMGASHLSLPTLLPEDVMRRMLQAMLVANVQLIDTADSYGWRHADANRAEAILAKLVAEIDPARGALILATKGGFLHDQGKWMIQGEPSILEKAIERSFDAHGARTPIALWQLHAPDPEVPIGRSLEAAARAKKRGLVERIGVSNVSAEQLRQALNTVELVSVQNQHSPWYRHPEYEEIFSLCRENNLCFLAHTPLGGMHSIHLLQRLRTVKQLASDHNVCPYTLVVAWLIREHPNLVPLTGSINPEHMKSNQEACRLNLGPDEWGRLDLAFEKARNWLNGRRT